MSVEIQGYLVEKLSGQSLPKFLREHIFEPLDMVDSGFYVPEAEMSPLATPYRYDDREGLMPVPHDANVNVEPGPASGGGGCTRRRATTCGSRRCWPTVAGSTGRRFWRRRRWR